MHTFDEYCRALEAVIPGACGPAPMPPPVIPPARVASAYSTASARRMVQAEIAAQVDTARKRTGALLAVREAAAKVRTECSGEVCEAKATTLVRPALLQREIEVHQLVVRRRTAMLADSVAKESGLAIFERRFNSGAADFQRQLLRTNLPALDQAVKRLTSLGRRSPGARPVVAEWRRKLEVRRRGPVPASDQARFYVMREPSEETARTDR